LHDNFKIIIFAKKINIMQSKSNLLTCLSAVEDPRRKQGQRYSINAMLTIIIMCALRNRFGYHETGRFCEHNREKPIKMFGFRNGRVPSYGNVMK
jgi:hypothetical protein